ncbi:MAG: response regulator [Clostridium sp.]|uniref:Stage 0 sporulation protein A homolog n=1 Tax=Clostridium sartagoforme AAU1 TaxID=1202534 RepID=R9BVN3_9CLOT|nr:response regulator [Clostridium sartagoforme]EOR21097.1 two component transcriptional regulator, arac family protein [Clostridium sartagoforme AAU1]MBS5949083.1 response regulator [Clostridium sp.]
MKILVVDDDKIIRMGLTKILKRLFDQHEVVSDFQNGLVALEYLKENKIDLVITDIKMPIMTGVQLIENAVSQLENPPIFVVLSGYDEFTYVRDTMKSGAFNYLLKPIKQDDLKMLIEEVEVKIKENGEKEKIINKSIDILKKDFFKNILFSKGDTSPRINKMLLENIQLNENYIYKMIIIDRDKNNERGLVSNFIKDISERFKGIEYLSFNYEDNTYIIFYLDSSINNCIDRLNEYIEENVDVFIENNKNVYIVQDIDKVWKLKEQSKGFRKLKTTISSNGKAKKYLLNLEYDLSTNDKSESKKTNLIAIKLAKQYIIDNFNKNITLKEVADKVFLSQNYLSELFKKETGEGFYDFLSRYRVNIAKDLLTKTNLKVYEVAENVGYSDSITFGRAFKKITGETPNSFRNCKE